VTKEFHETQDENKKQSETQVQHNPLSKTQKIALRGMLVAVAFVLSWAESQFPTFVAVPGIKIGLTNLVVLTALYRLSTPDAVVINGVRILLAGLTFGNLFSMVYSFSGGVLSTLVMIALKKTGKFSITGVSIAGGIFHNVGQLLVAMVVLQSQGVWYYLGVLWIGGLVAGFAVGILGGMITKRIF
jgi:heptaprenyl diphosphate synthase